MKVLSRHFSMTSILPLLVGLSLVGAPCFAKPAPCHKVKTLVDNDGTVDRDAHRWPTFCEIPPTPRDLRGAQAFKAAVLNTRLVGRDVDVEAKAGPFSLSDTEDFAARARMDAAAPPPLTPTGAPDAAEFTDQARARPAPPARAH